VAYKFIGKRKIIATPALVIGDSACRLSVVEGIILVGGADMAVRIFTAFLRKEENLYVAECPEVGTVSQGYTVEEAIANLKEVTELCLEDFPYLNSLDRC